MKEIKNLLINLSDKANLLGLQIDDINNAKMFINHNEFLLCFETITTQIYENEVAIDKDFYLLICEIIEKMNLQLDNYSHLKELLPR